MPVADWKRRRASAPARGPRPSLSKRNPSQGWEENQYHIYFSRVGRPWRVLLVLSSCPSERTKQGDKILHYGDGGLVPGCRSPAPVWKELMRTSVPRLIGLGRRPGQTAEKFAACTRGSCEALVYGTNLFPPKSLRVGEFRLTFPV